MKFNRYLTHFALGLNLILVLFLVFENKLSIPWWFSPAGRIHPLLLHLPIGALGLLIALFFIKKHLGINSFNLILKAGLIFLSISAAISAIAGLLLAQEQGYDPASLNNHKWTGFGFSIASYFALEFFEKISKTEILQKSMIALLVIISILVGHLGGEITHGENFVFENLKKEEPIESQNLSLYELKIQPILKEKCVSCHNDQKTKGDLNMSSIEKLLKGGKNGFLWKAGDTLNSHILKRANLPLDDKKHMPPKGKPQLSTEEIFYLTQWISEGANTKIKLSELPNNSFFKKLADEIKTPEKVYSFKKISEEKIAEISSPYCTIVPFSSQSPALSVSFFVSSKFEPTTFDNLSKIKTQIVRLNLAKMPVDDNYLKKISEFENLEYLNLNQTDIKGNGIDNLLKCKKLKELAISNTKISKQNFEKILTHPALKKVFIWNTALQESDIVNLEKKYRNISFDKGFETDESQKLALNTPILVNENLVIKDKEKVSFKHPLNEVKIRYTLDGSEPDTLQSPVYTQPIEIQSFTKIKLVATKPGWLASKPVEYNFYKSKFKALSAVLMQKANESYLGKGASGLIDLKQGDITNYKEENWLGFRENNFEALINLSGKEKLEGITLSYGEKADSYIMPPEWVEIWIKEKNQSLKLYKKVIPPQLEKMQSGGIKAINLPLSGSQIVQVKLVAKPVAKLPNWHPGKGDKGWFFVDEVFFY
jgi:hypothetical protein